MAQRKNKRLILSNIKKQGENSMDLKDMDNAVEANSTLPETISDEDINKVEDLEDGSTVYEIGKPKENKVFSDKFSANLAITMKEETLKNISSYLLECLDEDIEARQSWLDIHDKVKKYLGHNLEDLSDAPFTQSCRTFDTTLSTALLRFCATSRGELLPESGPCGYKIFGQSNLQLEEVAKIRSQWLNYFLTTKDDAYYKDYEKSLYYVGFYGTIIKKVYYDSILKQPVSRFILPENFLINIDCTSILESDRLTHILKMSAREVLTNQKNGTYREVQLPYLKASRFNSYTDSDDDTDSSKKDNIDSVDYYSQRSLYDVYECHTYLNLEAFEPDYSEDQISNVAKPYIITIDKCSKEILSIKRNWKKDDERFIKIKYFVSYQYFTGFDIWGLGLARIAGTNAIAVTNMLRQTIDAATYQNIPSGFIQKGTSKQQKTSITLGAGEWHMLDAVGANVRDLFAPLPANGPSPALIQLRQELIGQMQEQLSTSELGMMDSKEDIPTGTAIAFLEENNKIQSAVLKSLHNSFSEELRLLDAIFKEVITEEEFYIDGQRHIINKEHFVDSIQIVPVSDPSTNSNIQRIMRAEAVFQTAMQLPEKIDMIQLLKVIFQAQGLDDSTIESLIIKENDVEPIDPVSENMNMMQGKPVKAGIEQNHDAHIVVHSAVDNEESKAHIQEHMALKFMLEMQNAMGVDLSQIDPNDPEMQNMIALKAAEAVEHLNLNKHGDDEDKQIDPNQLYAMDIQQKKEANIIKKEIADMKLESDTFKSQLHFEETKQRLKVEKEKMLIDARLEIEKLKQRAL